MKYSENKTPNNYVCQDCGVTGVKLWRKYQTFLNHQILRCAECAVKSEKVDYTVDEDGRSPISKEYPMCKTDQIGWLVPAVNEVSDIVKQINNLKNYE